MEIWRKKTVIMINIGRAGGVMIFWKMNWFFGLTQSFYPQPNLLDGKGVIVILSKLANWKGVGFFRRRGVFYEFWSMTCTVSNLAIIYEFLCPVGIYLLKVNNGNTRLRCKICSTLTIKAPERRHISHHISHLVLVFLLLTLNMQLSAGRVKIF